MSADYEIPDQCGTQGTSAKLTSGGKKRGTESHDGHPATTSRGEPKLETPTGSGADVTSREEASGGIQMVDLASVFWAAEGPADPLNDPCTAPESASFYEKPSVYQNQVDENQYSRLDPQDDSYDDCFETRTGNL